MNIKMPFNYGLLFCLGFIWLVQFGNVSAQVVLPSLPGVNGTISVIIPDGNGGIYIGGNFSQVLTSPAVNRNDIAQIASDGSVTSWNPDSRYLNGASNSSIAGMVKVGNTIYVVGQFDKIGLQNRRQIAGIDITSGLATSLDIYANAGVYSIVNYGNNIYVGGSFDNIQGISRSRLAAIDITNNQITAWNPNPDADVGSLLLDGTTLYVGGAFLNIGGQSRSRFAALDINTGLATAWNPGMNNVFPGFAVNGNDVYVGGNYTVIGGQNRNRLAVLSAIDGSVLPWNPNVSGGVVGSMTISNGVLFVGGSFTNVGGNIINRLVSFDILSGNVRAWNPNPNGNRIGALLPMPNDVIYVGGDFTNIAGANRTGLVALSTKVRQDQTITFAQLQTKTVGDAQFNLTASASSSLSVSYASSNTAVATISGSTVTIVGVGSTTISAFQAGDVDYKPATSVQQILTVKQNQTIIFNTLSSKIYGAVAFNLIATASSGLPVSYTSSDPTIASISGSTVTILKAGTVNITCSQTGDATYNAAANVVQSLTINKANQTITFTALPNKAVGDTPFNLTANASSGLSVSYVSSNTAVATISGNAVTVVGIGSTTITASQSGDANYNTASSVQQTLMVTAAKQNQIITFNTLAGKTFGDASFNLTATSSSGLGVTYISSDPTTASISGSSVTILKTGTVNITASQTGDATYNAALDVVRPLTINKANQTITFSALSSKAVNDPPFNLAGTTSSGLSLSYTSSNSTVATVNGSTVTFVGIGATTITASQAGNTNYNAATSVQQTLTVNPAKQSQTITFTALPVKTFGDAAVSLAATASSQLVVNYTSSNTAVATISANTVKIVGAGTSTITASQAGNDTFGAATNVTQTLTVNKASQTITFAALPAKTATDAAFALTATASSNLSVSYSSSNTAVATISGSTVTIVGAGTSTITATQAGNDNYNAATVVTLTLTVTTKQSQTITFAALPAKTFGDAAFTLAATASSQLAVSYASSNTAVATISGNTVTIVGAGTSTITASQAGNDTFGAAANVTQTLTVNKASQTITFAALPAKFVGNAAFALTATGGASGLPVTFVSSNTAVATISGSTVTIVAVGTTNITASQAGNDNYAAATDVVQVLTVSAKQNQTITFTLADKTFGDAAFPLTATASSNLPVAYSTTSDKITISGAQVTLVKAGRASIVANQAGNDFFNAATGVTQSFCIKPAKPTVTLSNTNTETVTLTSSASAGNQWYLAGTAIVGATSATLAVTAPGVYKVQVKVDDCNSEFSADQTIIVTGDVRFDGAVISISPNPVDILLQLNGIVGEIRSNQLFDTNGRVASSLILEKKNDGYSASVEHLNQGLYMLRILQENKVIQVKFIKK